MKYYRVLDAFNTNCLRFEMSSIVIDWLINRIQVTFFQPRLIPNSLCLLALIMHELGLGDDIGVNLS